MTRLNDVAGSIIGGRLLPKRIGSLLGISDANGQTFWFDLDQRFAISHAQKDGVKACVIQIEGHPGAVYGLIGCNADDVAQTIADARGCWQRDEIASTQAAETQKQQATIATLKAAYESYRNEEMARLDALDEARNRYPHLCRECAGPMANTCPSCEGPIDPAKPYRRAAAPAGEKEPRQPQVLTAQGALDNLADGAAVAIQYDGRTLDGKVKRNESGVAFVECEGGCLIRSAITSMMFRRADLKGCPTAAEVADVEGRAARAATEGGSGIIGTIRPGEGLQPAPLGSAENPHLAELSAAELETAERELADAARELGLDDQAAAKEEAEQKGLGANSDPLDTNSTG